MYSPEALLDPVGIPWQVVIDHQMSALEVYAFSSGIRGEKDLHHGIVKKGLLGLSTLLSSQPTMNDHERFTSAKERRNLVLQVVESIPVLCKDDEFPLVLSVDEECRQFAPLRICSASAHGKSQVLQSRQRGDFRLQFFDRARRGGLIENLFFRCLDFVFRCIFQILDIIGIECGSALRQRRRDGTPLKELHLTLTLFEPFASSPERLVNGFGGRSQAALQ